MPKEKQKKTKRRRKRRRRRRRKKKEKKTTKKKIKKKTTKISACMQFWKRYWWLQCGPGSVRVHGRVEKGRNRQGVRLQYLPRRPRLKHVWNVLHTSYSITHEPSHLKQQKEWIVFFDHCELLHRMIYCTNYCDSKQILRRYPLRNPPLLRTPSQFWFQFLENVSDTSVFPSASGEPWSSFPWSGSHKRRLW